MLFVVKENKGREPEGVSKMSKKNLLNLETVPMEALRAIYEVDKGFIGTKSYMGIACFWNNEYRSFLGDASMATRKNMHLKFLAGRLDVSAASPMHLKILKYFCPQ